MSEQQQQAAVVVTRQAALERFIQERVLGDRGFSIQGNMCLYAGPNGGCEIGQYLPRELALKADEYAWSATILAHKAAGLVEFEGLGESENANAWWQALQRAHDNLAYHVAYRSLPGAASNNWQNFVEALGEMHMLEGKIEKEQRERARWEVDGE